MSYLGSKDSLYKSNYYCTVYLRLENKIKYVWLRQGRSCWRFSGWNWYLLAERRGGVIDICVTERYDVISDTVYEREKERVTSDVMIDIQYLLSVDLQTVCPSLSLRTTWKLVKTSLSRVSLLAWATGDLAKSVFCLNYQVI